jgi:hypothetical protein
MWLHKRQSREERHAYVRRLELMKDPALADVDQSMMTKLLMRDPPTIARRHYSHQLKSAV